MKKVLSLVIRAGFRTATPPPGAILVSVSGLLGAAWCIRRLATV